MDLKCCLIQGVPCVDVSRTEFFGINSSLSSLPHSNTQYKSRSQTALSSLWQQDLVDRNTLTSFVPLRAFILMLMQDVDIHSLDTERQNLYARIIGEICSIYYEHVLNKYPVILDSNNDDSSCTVTIGDVQQRRQSFESARSSSDGGHDDEKQYGYSSEDLLAPLNLSTPSKQNQSIKPCVKQEILSDNDDNMDTTVDSISETREHNHNNPVHLVGSPEEIAHKADTNSSARQRGNYNQSANSKSSLESDVHGYQPVGLVKSEKDDSAMPWASVSSQISVVKLATTPITAMLPRRRAFSESCQTSRCHPSENDGLSRVRSSDSVMEPSTVNHTTKSDTSQKINATDISDSSIKNAVPLVPNVTTNAEIISASTPITTTVNTSVIEVGNYYNQCNSCGRHFTSLASWTEHERSQSCFKYVCKTCNEQFNTHTKYIEHSMTHLPSPTPTASSLNWQVPPPLSHVSWPAAKNDVKFRNPRFHETPAIAPHDVSHQIQQATDSSRPSTAKRLQSSRPKFMQKTAYRCPECRNFFATSSGLLTHMRTHTGEKPYSCTYCGKCFNDRCNAKRHEKIHTGIKPHVCPKCDRKFYSPGDLKKHSCSKT